MHNEKRKSPRANVICKICASFAERTLVFDSHTENLGEGGMRVILNQKLHIPTTVDVELFFDSRVVPVKCRGEVIWVKERVPEGIRPLLFDTGIKFLDLGGSQLEEIRSLVSTVTCKQQQ